MRLILYGALFLILTASAIIMAIFEENIGGLLPDDSTDQFFNFLQVNISCTYYNSKIDF